MYGYSVNSFTLLSSVMETIDFCGTRVHLTTFFVKEPCTEFHENMPDGLIVDESP
jgi:hypothetical protein